MYVEMLCQEELINKDINPLKEVSCGKYGTNVKYIFAVA